MSVDPGEQDLGPPLLIEPRPPVGCERERVDPDERVAAQHDLAGPDLIREIHREQLALQEQRRERDRDEGPELREGQTPPSPDGFDQRGLSDQGLSGDVHFGGSRYPLVRRF